ncbi:MAG: hypothetical protein GVY30_12665 [Chloroflexi bacterium]|nr:hypothetical protein [Chloroflexota bacterium]
MRRIVTRSIRSPSGTLRLRCSRPTSKGCQPVSGSKGVGEGAEVAVGGSVGVDVG